MSARIVCIEDDSEMIEVLRLMLSRQGYEVFGAVGGQVGLVEVDRLQPDVVLLDLMMPGMDGWEVYRRLKDNPATCNIPVIMLTAKAKNSERIKALREAQVDDFIAKPFSPNQLVDSIERALRRRTNGSTPA